MEIEIDKKVLNTIENVKDQFSESKFIGKYEQAIIDFEELIAKGLATRRGNQLISITESHLHRTPFNTTTSKSELN